MTEATSAADVTPSPFAGGDWFDPLEEAVRLQVRGFIEELLEEELEAALGRGRYERSSAGKGHRHGRRTRQLVTTFGPLELSVPRGRLRDATGEREWKSASLPAYKRLSHRAEALIAQAYLAGMNTRRVRRALGSLFAGHVGKDVVSRAWQRTRSAWETWQRRDLAGEDIVRLILDGTVVKVRLDRKATTISLLIALGIRRDGQKVVLAIKSMGGESEAAWRQLLDDLTARGMAKPELVVVDGGKGLEAAVASLWTDVPVQRCTVHKERNPLAHAPKQLHEEIKADFNDMMHAKTARFGKEIAAAFKALPVGTALIDGEVVVENQNGASDFSLLQADLSQGRVDRFVYYAFDLMYLDGYDLRATPLVMRKAALAQLLTGERGILRYSEHFEQDGDLILQHACRLSLEGVLSKLRDGSYRSGRGKSWVKSKCSQRQEFVVAGYVPSTTSRKAIGSLVLGYHDGGKLIHAGRVGTGYTAAVAEDLYRRLERIRSPSSSFAERLSANAARQVRYVKPQLVAEVEFRGWTGDQNLRHASFRGLREDKAAMEIVRETVGDSAKPPPRTSVKLTHPDRVYWPDAGVTKEGLAQRIMAEGVVRLAGGARSRLRLEASRS